MDDELKRTLEAMEGRLGGRITATNEKMGAMNEKMEAMEGRLVERIHDSETKILTAFYSWARPVDSRINKHLPALDERLGWLEQRMAELERKNLERGL